MNIAATSSFVLNRRHLLGIEGLSREEIVGLLDLAEEFVDLNRQIEKKRTSLRGRTQINLFFESSTRTQSSFELAGKRLGADVMNMAVGSSAMKKGETLIDTAMTLNAMHPDILVVRHHASGAVELLAQKVDGSVINAGDGAHEHPTQALLDALTIRRNKGRIEGLIIAICGDVLHSRVARSNIILLNSLAHACAWLDRPRFCRRMSNALGVEVTRDMREGLQNADIVMMLRLQRERMNGSFVPSTQEYFAYFGLDQRKLGFAKSDALVMHPGPMNRGVEIDSSVADGAQSLIREQVEMGVAVRMAVLEALSRNLPNRLNMLSDRRPILLTNARIVDPSRDLDFPGDLLIADGVIRDTKRGIGAAGVPEGTEVVDCKGRIVAPGLIDIRAFVGEPGAEYRDTLATASQAAAAGGVTTIICQPDTTPAIDDPAIVDFILRRARDTAIVHVQPMAALTKGLEGKEMTEIGLLKAAGAVAFTDGTKSVTNAQVMRRTLTYARDFDALVVHHTEDPDLIGEGVMNEGEFATRLGLHGIPTAAEAVMLERDMRLVALTGCRYHAASITCRDSLDILRRAKDAGLPVSAAASINHLTLNEIDIGPYRTFFKLTPPLRGEDDRAALAEAVSSGLIDIIMSDHNPQDVETKRLPFAEAAPGAVGLETMLTAGLRLVHGEHLSLMQMLAAMSTKPAELLGLPGGSLRNGAPADVIVIDPDTAWVLDPTDLKSKCKNTPFDEARLEGRVIRTIVAGRTAYEYAFA